MKKLITLSFMCDPKKSISSCQTRSRIRALFLYSFRVLQLSQQGLTVPPLRPGIIDFEASGFGIESYPIEVGVALSSGQKYCALIKPASHWTYWDQKAEHVHGLSVEDLRAHGKPINVVARELNALLGDCTLYSDGWVVDKSWLSKLFYHCGISPMFFPESTGNHTERSANGHLDAN